MPKISPYKALNELIIKRFNDEKKTLNKTFFSRFYKNYSDILQFIY